MPARVHNDPDANIRVVKGNRFQVRPYGDGKRYTLPGTYATMHQARKARDDFWWGRIPEIPYGTRAYRTRDGGTRYAALRIAGGRVAGVISWHESREEAGRVAALHACPGSVRWRTGLMLAEVASQRCGCEPAL